MSNEAIEKGTAGNSDDVLPVGTSDGLCDGWIADSGCDKFATISKPGWGNKKYCKQCADRLQADNKAWAYISR